MNKLVLIGIIALTGCQQESCSEDRKLQKKPSIVIIDTANESTHQDRVEYHIKAAYWGDCYWQVIFTDDSFDTQHPIVEYMWPMQDTAVQLFHNQSEAFIFARTMKNYAQCLRYNYQQIKLMEHARENTKKENELRGNKPKCEDERGKEIIVY